jgi:hypothetical protein
MHEQKPGKTLLFLSRRTHEGVSGSSPEEGFSFLPA